MLKTLQQAVRSLRGKPALDPATERYIAWNREKWRRDWTVRDRGVVLVSVFQWAPTIHCYAHAANHLARRNAAAIEAFTFAPQRSERVEEIYESFGAPVGLSAENAEPFHEKADALAAEVFAKLGSKEELCALTFDGLLVGDLIYDTYLRHLAAPTVDLRDPRLLEFIRDAARIYHATTAYFDAHRVVALLPDHTVYIHCGIVARVAACRGVPVLSSYYTPDFYLTKLECGAPGCPVRWPWWRYRELFAALAPERQEKLLARGRQSLQERLAGKVQPGVIFGNNSAYESGGERLLSTSDKPKVLVMLHDFCDAVHVYRDVLFPDFYEWIRFVLERASATPFEWYVKPHPNLRDRTRAAMNATNDAMVAQLGRDFPRVQILPPSASNKQLIEEGVCALFTVYGTAGHEFAYLGVPAVNAGDNPHIAYGFNFHPRTRDELAALIARADSLEAPADRASIEEYHAMNYFYFPETLGSGVQLIDPAVGNSPAAGSPEIFDRFIADASAENDARLDAWFDTHFGSTTN